MSAAGGKEAFYNYFEFGFEGLIAMSPEGDQDQPVTQLFAGEKDSGFFLDRGHSTTIGKLAWDKFMQISDMVGVLRAIGFRQQDGIYFLPIKFNAEALALAIEQDDLSTFLTPLRTALSRLTDAASAIQPALNIVLREVLPAIGPRRRPATRVAVEPEPDPGN